MHRCQSWISIRVYTKLATYSASEYTATLLLNGKAAGPVGTQTVRDTSKSSVAVNLDIEVSDVVADRTLYAQQRTEAGRKRRDTDGALKRLQLKERQLGGYVKEGSIDKVHARLFLFLTMRLENVPEAQAPCFSTYSHKNLVKHKSGSKLQRLQSLQAP